MSDDMDRRAERIATIFFPRDTQENKQLREMIARELSAVRAEGAASATRRESPEPEGSPV